ncbi:MAG: phosphoribosylformylglycinamidine synthase subunit PurS [Polyangiaceae bacterium]
MGETMKVTVLVRLKGEVLDPQGDAVKHALGVLGFEGVQGVRIGKLVEIELDASSAQAMNREAFARMADELLANPVVEDYEIQMSK